jgi:hypothetical protein
VGPIGAVSAQQARHNLAWPPTFARLILEIDICELLCPLSSKVIELAQRGVRDATALSTMTLKELSPLADE